MRRVLEIRVHGVSNTPPESMLRDRWIGEPVVRLCAGDEQTGFYRRCGDSDSADLVTEAYSWGQLTSGNRAKKDVQRAGWALLLPFALVNVALWARPEIADDPFGKMTAYVVRLLALSLTVTLVLAAAGVGMDQVGWQCRDGCPRTVPGTAFLSDGAFWSSGLRPVAVGIVAPVVLVAVLWLLARRSFTYEAEVATSEPPARSQNPLEEPSFWSGDAQVRRLAALHVSAALAAIAGVAVRTGSMVDAGRQPAVAVRMAGWAAGGLACIAAVLIFWSLTRPEVRDRGADGPDATRAFWPPIAALWSSAAAIVLVLVFLIVPGRSQLPDVQTLPGFGDVVQWFFVGQFALVLLLGALVSSRTRAAVTTVLVLTGMVLAVSGVTATWTPEEVFQLVVALSAATAIVALAGRLRRDETHSCPVWGGRSAALLAGAGWTAGSLYSAAVLFWMADWLNGDATVTSSVSAVQMPTALLWSATGLVAFVVPVLVAGAFAIWTMRGLRRGERAAAVGKVPKDPGNAHERRRAVDVGSAVAMNRFVGEKGVGLVGLLGAVVVAYTIIGVAGSLTGLSPNALAVEWTQVGGVVSVVKWLTDTGSALAGLLLLGVAALVGLAYRSPGPRRTLGVVWDLSTFWPRGAHPFAPPCYGERAVPQLLTRICGVRNRSILLAGHSQGAVLAVATLLQMPADRRRQVYLLTFGTQLTRLYGRLFPAFFGLEARRRIADVLRTGPAPVRWRSLHRRTDPLGWEIGEPRGIDVEVNDPDALAPQFGEVLDPPIRRHSDYPCSAAYQQGRFEAIAQLRTEYAAAKT
jgi:hypothetical protein